MLKDKQIYYIDRFFSEQKSGRSILNDISDLFNGYGKNINGGDLWQSIKDFVESWQGMLSSMPVEQLGFHLLSALFILLCLITIIIIVYSEFLLNYLKIEEKYPRLGEFIKIRKAFQQYYLFINFMFILITLFSIIFINYTILF